MPADVSMNSPTSTCDKALSPHRSDFDGYILPGMSYREVHAGTFISSGFITGTGYLLNAGIESSYT